MGIRTESWFAQLSSNVKLTPPFLKPDQVANWYGDSTVWDFTLQINRIEKQKNILFTKFNFQL